MFSDVALCQQLMALSAAIFIRVAVSLHPYSGADSPPMFGDFEAQRHWMEITYNLPLCQWYVNSSVNHLEYWGLDYPPLTAYHSWLMGAVSACINPNWIALQRSQGYQSDSHKLFMRLSVLSTDILVYFTAVIAYVNYIMQHLRSQKDAQKIVIIFVILCQPAIILIDHGHFQYNSLSLGLTLWAITSVLRGWQVFGSILFCLAINYKQMELYHSLPFFFYLLGRAILSTSSKHGLFTVTKLGLTVISMFTVCWVPFYICDGTLGVNQVITRIFPVDRGVYEDKVASFWCSLSLLIKIKNMLSATSLVWLSVLITLFSALPSLLNLLRNPTIYRFLLSLVISSLSFYLFSFHVHEKTILLVTLPVSLLIIHHPFVAVWFNIVATFSMYPLLMREGLSLPTWIVSGLFLLVTLVIFNGYTAKKPHYYQSLLLMLSLTMLMGLCLLAHLVPPPPSLPDIFAVFISCYCCILFMLTMVYFSYVQLSLENEQWNSILECNVSQCMYQIVGRSNINLNINKDHKE